VLGRMLRLAYENGNLHRLPIIRQLKEAGPRSGFFERNQYEAVGRRLPDDLKVAVAIAYTFGGRIKSEVLPLTLAQVELAAGTLRLEPGHTKNDDGRLVHLTPELTALLRAQVNRVKDLMRSGGRDSASLLPPVRPVRRQAAAGFYPHLADGLQERRVPGDAPARFPAHGDAEHGECRCA
jgi:integrase